ncbi:MAG: alpha/beta fold hydrolase [Gemmatimonadaceae bacterium]
MPLPIPPPRVSGLTTTTTTPLYWAAWGPESAPDLLVLHGGPGAHHDYLLPQMLHLAERYNLVFYDQRGGGRSKSASTDAITWQTHVEDMSAVIQELDVSPLSIIGYSFGGMLALLYTLTADDSVDLEMPVRLALIDPAPLKSEYRRQFEADFARRQEGLEIKRMREELAASGLRESDPEAYRQRTFELAVAAYFADPRKAHDLTPFRVSGKVQQQVWDSLGAGFDVLADLKPMGFPVLFVHGRDDPIPVESSIEGAKAMGAELVLLDDCGHVPYVEQPAALFEALDRFLLATDPR